MIFNQAEKLAKYVINEYLESGQKPNISRNNLSDTLIQKAASFVTVYHRGLLRGCIGNVDANGPLYQSIIDNSISAITEDTRFTPLSLGEVPDVSIEVTILSPLIPFLPKSNDELISYLSNNKPGLVIAKGYHRAVFLPQVWEQLPNPINFLEELCIKAGLSTDSWKKEMKFQIFTKLSETDLLK